MSNFEEQIKSWTELQKKKIDAVTRKIVLDVGTSVVLKSPVGDPTHWQFKAPPGYVGGRFRGNWQYGLTIADGTTETIDPSGQATIGAIFAKVDINASGKHHYLVNRLPYGPRLEHGWSRQAPAGMVQITVVEFKPIVRAAVTAIRAEMQWAA